MRSSFYKISWFLIISLSICSASFAEDSSPESWDMALNAELSPAQSTHPLQYPGASSYEEPLKKFFPDCDPKKSGDFAQATGTGSFWFDASSNELSFLIAYSGLSGDPIMAHFHYGAPGTGGPIIQTICGQPPPSSAIGYSNAAVTGTECPNGKDGFFKGTYTLQGHRCPPDAEGCQTLTVEQERQLLLRGTLYVNLHTCLNQPGEIRGQVVPLRWEGLQSQCNDLPPKKPSK